MKREVQNTLVAFIILMFVVACTVKTTEDSTSNTLQVKGYRVTEQPFQNELKTTADIMANEQVELKAPMSGQVMDIFFKEGQSVSEGKVLVQLDDRTWKAEMIGVAAELEAAEKDLERKKALSKIGGSSQVEIDQAISLVETLKSRIQQLKVNIDLAKVTAPFSGQLGMRNFSKGAFLSQGDIISTLTEINKLKVDFTVSQNHGQSIEVGTRVWILIGTDTLEATIYAINPVIDAQTRTINARALLEQRGEKKIMPGTFAEVLVTTNYLKDALMIPTQAVVQSITEQTVYISNGGVAERRVIQLGNRTAEMVHVLDGIEAGDTVLTTGLLSVKEGMDLIFQSVN
ncbi:MAG: efflux RND transporter periplasmic adaptor subunit [Ekhidna sp.]|uniref:efflux RND transporter periplasmic adaptor subunit n=1 Tax=Ekhidna sp. TaxID=2608089 RepID=UPI0032ED6B24